MDKYYERAILDDMIETMEKLGFFPSGRWLGGWWFVREFGRGR